MYNDSQFQWGSELRKYPVFRLPTFAWLPNLNRGLTVHLNNWLFVHYSNGDLNGWKNCLAFRCHFNTLISAIRTPDTCTLFECLLFGSPWYMQNKIILHTLLFIYFDNSLFEQLILCKMLLGRHLRVVHRGLGACYNTNTN